MLGFWDYVGAAATVLFGVAQLFIGFGILRQTVERAVLWLRGHRARAVITSVGEERDSDSHRVYRPSVEFTTPTGEPCRVDLADTTTTRPRIGARITVVYRPDDPGHVDAVGIGKGIGSLVAFPILVVVGAAATVLPIAYLLGLDSVLSWSEQAAHEAIDRLGEAIGGPLGRVRDVLLELFG
ncbi:DUF3592 domain-containing protein [Nocardia asteroides]|uniref:DUF3592 domain-containing protein n=1 Tax=Nocardia asteroides TaxID=1824 RepID=UPI001E5381AE|nr:DUF3592 domain-containing protein [Nocardia asteroides]UGT62198.1 DUF3592 domain-containing protein [Nocardia asteroides]